MTSREFKYHFRVIKRKYWFIDIISMKQSSEQKLHIKRLKRLEKLERKLMTNILKKCKVDEFGGLIPTILKANP